MLRPKELLAGIGVVTILSAAVASQAIAITTLEKEPVLKDPPTLQLDDDVVVALDAVVHWNLAVWNQTIWWHTVIKQLEAQRARIQLGRTRSVACTVRFVGGAGEGDCRSSTRPLPLAPSYNGSASGSVNGMPCGGDLPPCCVLRRESGGSPTARNRSGAAGLWQFMPGTWNGFGGYSSAADAPPSVQNEKARQVWAGGAGGSNWYPRCW